VGSRHFEIVSTSTNGIRQQRHVEQRLERQRRLQDFERYLGISRKSWHEGTPRLDLVDIKSLPVPGSSHYETPELAANSQVNAVNWT